MHFSGQNEINAKESEVIIYYATFFLFFPVNRRNTKNSSGSKIAAVLSLTTKIDF